MPVTIEPTERTDLTRISLSGVVPLSEFIQALAAYGKRGPTRLELYDVRRLEGDRFSPEDIDRLVTYLTQYPDRRPPRGRTAIVVSQTVDIGIARMLSILSEDMVSFKIEVFRSTDEARAWLVS